MSKEFYYTECCGKMVMEQQEYKSKNILQVGHYVGNGTYFCPKCDHQVTKTGKIKLPLNKVR